jgi:hypothetical protein
MPDQHGQTARNLLSSYGISATVAEGSLILVDRNGAQLQISGRQFAAVAFPSIPQQTIFARMVSPAQPEIMVHGRVYPLSEVDDSTLVAIPP